MLSLNQAIQQHLALVEGPVRISYANLVTHLGLQGSHKRFPVAVLNRRAHQKGEQKWQALGGAANLTRLGVTELREHFGATDFEIDEKSGEADARFIVPGHTLHEVAGWLINAGSVLVEYNPAREFCTETGISENWMSDIRFRELGIAIQPPAEGESDTSSRSQGKPPSRRIFRCFEAIFSTSEVCRAIWKLPHVRFLYDEELALTDGGRRGNVLSDGSVIANNLGVPICR